MKNTTMRKLAGIAAIVTLASCMMAPMGMTAFAAQSTTGTISINNTVSGHTYAAYQIFDGSLSGNVLSNIVWGPGVDTTTAKDGKTLVQAIQAITLEGGETPFAGKTTAADIAAVLSGDGIEQLDAEITQKFAAVVAKYPGTAAGTADYEDSYTFSNLDNGYYLVMDTDSNVDAMTRYIVKVAGDATGITLKSSYPTVIKKVKENSSNTVTSTGEEFAGATDYAVGDQYNDVADYNIGDAVPFKLYGTLPSTLEDYSSYYYCFNDTLATQFDAPSAEDVKVYIGTTEITQGTNLRVTVTGQEIKVAFEDIIAAGATADSIVTVEYTAVLNETADIGLDGQMNTVDLTYSNNPNEEYAPNTGDNEVNTPDNTHDTPEDKVIVFTYELDVNKVDGANPNTKLEAEFLLQNADGKYATVDNAGIFTGWVDSKDDATTLKSTGGIFKVIGIDEGTYTLTETKEPDGYNLPASSFTVKLEATTVNNQTWDEFTPSDALTGLAVTVDNEAGTADTTGIASITIENNVGSTLPSTGGIGTTLFYVIGGTMAAGAGVYLISKKRMNKED